MLSSWSMYAISLTVRPCYDGARLYVWYIMYIYNMFLLGWLYKSLPNSLLYLSSAKCTDAWTIILHRLQRCLLSYNHCHEKSLIFISNQSLIFQFTNHTVNRDGYLQRIWQYFPFFKYISIMTILRWHEHKIPCNRMPLQIRKCLHCKILSQSVANIMQISDEMVILVLFRILNIEDDLHKHTHT